MHTISLNFCLGYKGWFDLEKKINFLFVYTLFETLISGCNILSEISWYMIQFQSSKHIKHLFSSSSGPDQPGDAEIL